MSIKLLLFDIDGTLVRLDGAGLRALDKTFFDFFGIKDVVFSINFFGKTDIRIYEEIAEAAGIDNDLLNKNINDIMEKYLEYLKIEIEKISVNPVIEGVYDFLNTASQKQDIILGLLTGNIEYGGYTKIRKWGLFDFFSFGAFGSDSKFRSDLVDIAVNRAKKKYNVPHFEKKEIFVIGDTPLDIKCAKDNGVVSVAVATGKYSVKELSEFNPDFCFPSITNWNCIF